MALNNNALSTAERVIKVIQTYPFLPEGLDFNDIDVIEEIERQINQWSEYIQKATRSFGKQTYTEFYNGTMVPMLTLDNYPVKEIISIERIDGLGNVTGSVDVEALANILSAKDLSRGLIYLEPNFLRRHSSIGVSPDLYNPLRSHKIVYKAGYVLPKDATVEEPSDLPADIEGLLMDIVKAVFVEATDNYRAQGLITLTEGNVQRMWGAPTQFSLNKQQEKILAQYKRKTI